MAVTDERARAAARLPVAVDPGSPPSPVLAKLAVVLLCASFPLHQLIVLPVVGPVTNATTLIGVVLTLMVLSQGLKVRPPVALLAPALLFTIWVVLSYFWSVEPDLTVARIKTYLSLLLVVGMLAALLHSFDDRRLAFQSFVAGTLLIVADVLRNFVRGDAANASLAVGRFAAGLANPNRTGATVVLGMVMAWYLLRLPMTTRFWRGINLTSLILSPLVVLLTASRSAFVASLPIAAVLLFSTLRGSGRGRVLAILVLFVGGLLLVAYVPQASFDRLQTVSGDTTGPGGGSLDSRADALEYGWEAFWDRPVAGFGAGTYAVVVERDTGRLIVAHNSYVSLLVELGVVGLGLFLAVVVYDLGHLRRAEREERLVGLLLLCTWGLVALFASLEDEKMTWLVFVLVGTLGKGDDPPPEPMPADDGDAPLAVPVGSARRGGAPSADDGG